MSKLLQRAGFASVGLAVLLCIVLLGLSLPIAGTRTFTVQTGSMEPAIKTGSLVFVHRVLPTTLRPGDVITYINRANSHQTITHRLLAIQTDEMGATQLIVQGDANALPDEPVAAGQIVGEVTRAVPYVGHFTNMLREPLGLALIIWLPAMGVVIEEIRRLSAYYRVQKGYRLGGYEPHRAPVRHPLLHAKVLIVGCLAVLVIAAAPTYAALQSDVTLGPSTISSAYIPPQSSSQCTVTGTNSVTVNNTTTQSASSGGASNTGNTNSGNATSGSASNTSSTSTTLILNNTAICP